MIIKSWVAIYSVPKLKLIEEYTFNGEVDKTIYELDYALQLKNVNIFAITDRLCIFDGESIFKGPTITLEEINNKDFKISFISFEEPYDIPNYIFFCSQSNCAFPPKKNFNF